MKSIWRIIITLSIENTKTMDFEKPYTTNRTSHRDNPTSRYPSFRALRQYKNIIYLDQTIGRVDESHQWGFDVTRGKKNCGILTQENWGNQRLCSELGHRRILRFSHSIHRFYKFANAILSHRFLPLRYFTPITSRYIPKKSFASFSVSTKIQSRAMSVLSIIYHP